jgi:hypothetical protein
MTHRDEKNTSKSLWILRVLLSFMPLYPAKRTFSHDVVLNIRIYIYKSSICHSLFSLNFTPLPHYSTPHLIWSVGERKHTHLVAFTTKAKNHLSSSSHLLFVLTICLLFGIGLNPLFSDKCGIQVEWNVFHSLSFFDTVQVTRRMKGEGETSSWSTWFEEYSYSLERKYKLKFFKSYAFWLLHCVGVECMQTMSSL